MAHTIYSVWFEQFNFPNEDGKPYKSSGGKMIYNDILKSEIPENWEVCLLKDIFIENPKSKIKANDSNNGKYIFFTSGENDLQYDKSISELLTTEVASFPY